MNGMGVRERLVATGNRLVRAGLAGTALLVAVAIAAGCDVSPPSPPQRAPLSFAGHPPLVFDLGRIEVVESPAAPDPSDVDHLFPTPPAVAVRLWVEDRLRASGSTGLLRVTVEEAGARITPLATNTDLEGLLTQEQSEQLDARLRVTIEALDGSGTVRGSATVDTTRSRTLPEGITLAERELIYDEIVEALLNDYNASLEQAIRRYLHTYLR